MTIYVQQNLFGTDTDQDDIVCTHTVCVAIEDSAVDRSFDYLVPDKLWPVEVGQRVEVPFGRGNHKKTGFCIASDIKRQGRKLKLKKISRLLDERPLLDDNLVELAKWISSYYICPIGQVLTAMVPSAVKKNIGVQTKRYFYLIDGEASLRGVKQKKVVEVLKNANAFDGESGIEQKELLELVGCTAVVLKKLGENKIVKVFLRKVLKSLPVVPNGLANETAKDIVLNDDQKRTLEYINGEIGKAWFGVSLLHGVTDSGKTEVYIRAVQEAIKNGRTAIVLLPEIALTAQTVQRFKDRFDSVAVMHSGLSAAQRNVQWQNAKDGKAAVVIGARSAIFAPLKNVGLIVVDEEHEPSYKQDSTPRYHGRDVAIKRAQLENAHCVLGSATPSLESLHNCETKKYFQLLTMPKRVKDFAMPAMKLVDMKRKENFSRRDGVELISNELNQRLIKILSSGEQAILLLNRRGYSNYVFCPSCKHTLHCRNCDVSLTFHKSKKLNASGQLERIKTVTGKHNTLGYALCHYCLSRTLVPQNCPLCKTKMIMIGLGSQRLEEELARKFPQARVARIDSDSMQSKDYYEVLSDFGSGKIDILAGTQMLAKGLHFPNVTLVGIISADTSLCLPDFRANERTYQLIRQVAGRAGRGEKKGTVVVQSLLTEQPAIGFAMRNDFDGFVKAELQHRKACNLPPFGRMARILLTDESYGKLEIAAGVLREQIDAVVAGRNMSLTICGPIPAPIARIQRLYRSHIIITAGNSELIQGLFAGLRGVPAFSGKVKIAVDIDPVNVL